MGDGSRRWSVSGKIATLHSVEHADDQAFRLLLVALMHDFILSGLVLTRHKMQSQVAGKAGVEFGVGERDLTQR